jgi:hypothetical protein
MYTGIDYGLGRSNIDSENGIRYGVISQNSVLQAWADSAEPDYGEPTCGQCGNPAIEACDAPEEEWNEGQDYACLTCKRVFWSDEAFGDEPLGYSYEADGYKLTDCLDNDIFVLKSPYFTYAQFCSPCVPGAGNLDTTGPEGIKTYCLGHDWFDDSKAPYPVYSVETGEEVKS